MNHAGNDGMGALVELLDVRDPKLRVKRVYKESEVNVV
jgi:hypothetical protein